MQRISKPALSMKKLKNDSESYETSINVNYMDVHCTKVGYLSNIKPTVYKDPDGGADLAAVLLYFLEADGNWFKAMFLYEPYFYILCNEEVVKEVIFYLNKTYESVLSRIEYVTKEDLELINHLSGLNSKFLKLSFKNVSDLMSVRQEIMPIIKKNQENKEQQQTYSTFNELVDTGKQDSTHFLSKITDMREYDVPYHVRVCIDNELRCSFWYELQLDGPIVLKKQQLKSKVDKADLRIMAFDIETSKAPLKFPDARFDQIMMISYVIDGQGFLITNRTIVGDDVQDFEYSPKPEYDIGKFTIFNEADEKCLLLKFFSHIKETKPFILCTYNGDFFDWPFIDERCKAYELKLEEEIGVFVNAQGEYSGRFNVHMDCLYWVKRDAFLPQGSHGLKSVTKAKLGYDPVELEPELMVLYAKERPQELAEYSISDAVATYFLYYKMIHDFIFALCTIIPTHPDEVLRKGSGTLCEDLLMAQAFRGNIIFPNKQVEKFEKFYNGHLIDSETYIGGHVECLRTGVYRSDIPVKFRLEKSAYQGLIDSVEQIMDFAIKIEMGQDKNDITNYEQVKQEIVLKLLEIRDQCPLLIAEPLIYHVDVAAMYPNIILSNRLQPVAIVNEQICAGCEFNKEENHCKRPMNWQWKVDYYPLNRKEYERVKTQLEYDEEQTENNFSIQRYNNQQDYTKLKQRVKAYCQKSYKQVHTSKVELKSDTVCMRENSFYVDTVRDFRDRRYEYKNLVKSWSLNLKESIQAKDALKIEEAKYRVNLYESLQLAHKIILNSFYGYVMRRGARWYSMEMAAMVTHTGSNIITDSRALIDQIGMPLELDTDGIWTLLPKGFPESFQLQFINGKKMGFQFPCTMCNLLIYDKYSNKQYQTLVNKEKKEYQTNTEMSVFFEIDGPYRCMMIPASKEENKMLKKRYAVFTHGGKLQELKGFELKRRGELKIIKIFQQEVFDKFLEGKSLQECYDACGEVAERWYDILETEGEHVEDSELIEYIGESRVLSRSIAEYGPQKATAITCARRLAEFLGQEIVKDKGLCVKFIISKKPVEAKVADRAIPTAIFEADENVMKKFIRKWMKDSSHNDFDMRSIIDWQYYKERLAGTIQKIVTIPAALQKCLNPVPKIQYPDWLHKRLKAVDDKFKQKDMKYFFQKAPNNQVAFVKHVVRDIEGNEEKKVSKIVVGKPVQVVSKYENIENCPSPDEDFKEWLKFQKFNWRNIRKTMRSQKKLIQDKIQKPSLLTNFMRNMDEVVLNSSWHIVQIDEGFEAGVLRVWVFTENGSMFNVKLNVNRTIYINSKVASESSDFKKAIKIPPRGRKVYHLYEWEKPEEVYQEKFHNINYHHLMSHNIEGVYETKMPLLFKAILQLGCIVRPRQKMIPKSEQALGRTYSLNELEVKNHMMESHYLPSQSFQSVFLLHSQHKERHMWGLFTEATRDVKFFIVNPSHQQQMQQLKNSVMKNCFVNALAEIEEEVTFADWEVTSTQYFTDLTQCLKMIDQQLSFYKSKNRNSTMMVLQSEFTPEKLQFIGLPSLFNDFPCLKFPTVSSDNDYPAFDWMKIGIKNLTLRFVEAGAWLKDRINLSKYSYIPVGNLGQSDAPLFIIDTLFARSLSLSKHLLWYSDTSKPDLGGHEDKDFRIYYQEEMENPEITNKGFYRGYSVEMSITHLAINTIMQSEFLKEFEEAQANAEKMQMEGKNSKSQYKQNLDEIDADMDEFVTCSSAFRQLKQLVQKCVNDVMSGDEYADHILSHIYKWISSPTGAKLYDPLLHRLIHKLMQKNFFQLVLKLKSLGCQIIYAGFSKIIVNTQKQSQEEAENYIKFVIDTLKKQPMFSLVSLQAAEFYRIMLFKDMYNYGCVKEQNPEKVFTNWDIALHLPPAVQNRFKILVASFIAKTYKYNERLKKDEDLYKIEKDPDEVEKIEQLMDQFEDAKKERDHEFICNLIETNFSDQLFTVVKDYEVKKHEDDAVVDFDEEDEDDEDDMGSDQENEDDYNNQYDGQQYGGNNKFIQQRKRRERMALMKELKQWEFPTRIGTYNQYKSPALEFSKFVCNNIFGLDYAFKHSASITLKNLLKILHVQEFAQETIKGNEPSLVLVLPDVICSSCQNCRDIDICRDPKINDEDFVNKQNDVEYEDGDKEQRGDWSCQFCKVEPDMEEIEMRLVEVLNRRVVQYQMQDLKCRKCNMVKNSLMKEYCECTGTYAQTMGKEMPENLKNQNMLNSMTDMKLFVQLMRNFGIYHNMQVLKDISQQQLGLIEVGQ